MGGFMKLRRRFSKAPKVLDLKSQKSDVVSIQHEEPKFDEYFRINHNLSPPYNILIDTNFIIHSARKKLDVENELTKILLSNVKIFIPECVFGEIEKMGFKHRVSLIL